MGVGMGTLKRHASFVPETTSNPKRIAIEHPSAPSRSTAIETILNSARRSGVPIRKSFVQQGHGQSTKPGPLAGLVSRRDERGLDAYLLLHTAASAEPWDCTWPSSTWVHLLDLSSTATGVSANAAVSKVFARLAKTHALVKVQRSGRRSSIVLLKEDGSGAPYSRPATRDDPWFTLPHSYFAKGYDCTLSLSAKAMLLVALHLKDGAWLPTEYASEWFGISPSTARAGLTELVDEGLLIPDRKFKVDVKSPTLWAEKVSYHRAGPMRTRPTRKRQRSATTSGNRPVQRTVVPKKKEEV